MRRHLISAAAAGLLVGCGGDEVLKAPPAELTDFSPERRIERLWRLDTGKGAREDFLRLAPAQAGDAVYAADVTGRVLAIDLARGERHWEVRLMTRITGGVAAGEELVVVGSKKGELIALAQDTGQERWRAQLSSEVLAPAAIGRGVVVAQTIDGKLAGLSARDGAKLWAYARTEPALSLRGTAAPLLLADSVLAGFASGKIAALALKDGRLLGEHAIGEPRGRNEIERLVDVDVPPLIVEDKLIAAAYQSRVVAVSLRTGAIVWSREISTYAGLDADRERVYVSDENGAVIALDQRTGSSLWKQEKLHGRKLSAPTYVDGFVAVGDFEGYVHWLSAEDGRFIARYRLGRAPIRAAGVAHEGRLIIAGSGGEIAALRATLSP